MWSHNLGMTHRPKKTERILRIMPHLISIKEQTCKCSILQASGTIWQHPNQTQCTHNRGCFDEQIACIIEQPLSRDGRFCIAFLYEQLKQTAECLRTSSQLCWVLWLPSSATSLVCWWLIRPVGSQCPPPMAETSTSAPREVEQGSVAGDVREDGLLFWLFSMFSMWGREPG